MYVVTSLESQKGNNFGSSEKYVRYMGKDSDGLLFDNSGNFVSVDDAYKKIDEHSRGGIRNNEARWYTPVYSFSEEECLHVASLILKNGTIYSRNITTFDDLTNEEKYLYNEKIREIAYSFQDEMAANFNKQNLDINHCRDILWYGVVENKRYYTGYDAAVINKKAKQGHFKKGFNTHIHIVQSRKALNEKKSLISPMANARAKTFQGAGFDRNIFYNKVEQVFDKKLSYNRDYKKTFEYFKSETKTVDYWQKRGYKTVENRKPKYAHHISKNVDREVITNSRCVDYFFYLEKRGLLQFDKKIGREYYFKKKGQRTGSISVSDKGWYDFSDGTKGGILKAIQLYDKFDWQQSISLIKSLDGSYTDFKENQYMRELKVVKEVNKNNLIKYINKRGLSYELAKKYLNEVYYANNNIENYSLGFKNNSGGYVLRNDNFKSQLGKQDITSINFDKNTTNKKVLLFEGVFNYLSYLQLYGDTGEKAIILNSSGNFKKFKDFVKDKFNYTYHYYGDNDRTGDKLLEKIKNEKISVIDKRYLFQDKNDLNSYLVSKFNDIVLKSDMNININNVENRIRKNKF